MANYTSIILIFSVLENEDQMIELVNDFHHKKDFQINLVSVESPAPPGWYGGSKQLAQCIYLGAYKCFDYRRLLAHLTKLPWEYPEFVQLLVHDECSNHRKYHLFTLDSSPPAPTMQP